MKIAVIGAFCSGKSTALKVLEKMKIKTFKADDINAELLERADIVSKLKEKFSDAFTDGKVDKAKLRDILYSTKENYKQITDILTVEVVKEIKKIMKSSKGDIAIEMPLINEELLDEFDIVMNIHAEPEDRAKFLKKRGIDKAMAKKIMSFQIDPDDYIDYATCNIFNPGDYEVLEYTIRFSLSKMLGM